MGVRFDASVTSTPLTPVQKCFQLHGGRSVVEYNVKDATTKGQSSASQPNRHAPRTRSGCWTCRGRSVKCDETRPVCRKCVKAGYDRQYGIRLQWQDESESRGVCHGRQKRKPKLVPEPGQCRQAVNPKTRWGCSSVGRFQTYFINTTVRDVEVYWKNQISHTQSPGERCQPGIEKASLLEEEDLEYPCTVGAMLTMIWMVWSLTERNRTSLNRHSCRLRRSVLSRHWTRSMATSCVTTTAWSAPMHLCSTTRPITRRAMYSYRLHLLLPPSFGPSLLSVWESWPTGNHVSAIGHWHTVCKFSRT